MTITNTPVTQVGTPKAVCMLPEMELTWVMLPMPKEANRQNRLNSQASALPMPAQPL